MTNVSIPPESVDSFIAGRLPGWLTGAEVDHLLALHRALRRQETTRHGLGELLRAIPSLDHFAEPLLQSALAELGAEPPDVRGSHVRIALSSVIPSLSPALPASYAVVYTQQNLLAAALHNFHRDETTPARLRVATLVNAQGEALAMSFETFASCCRQLDIGGKYQALLAAHLKPVDPPGAEPGQARHAVERLFEESLRCHFEVAVRLATLRGELDRSGYLQMLPVFSPVPIVPALADDVSARQLYLLGKCMRGVVTHEVRDAVSGELRSVVAWVPGDPHGAVARYASWQSLYDTLAGRLSDASYRDFFCRFVSQRDRPVFLTTLGERLAAGTPAQLDGRHLEVSTSLFAHLRDLQVEKMFDDARVLAVPTDDEDQADRRMRLATYLSLGLDLLNLAGMFMPVVGEMMLVLAAAQIAGEVYEGYEDWKIGDRQGALDHLFGVAENVILGALIAQGSAVALRTLKRVPFVDDLVPVLTDTGETRLCSTDLSVYRLDMQQTALGHPMRVEDNWRVGTHDGEFQLEEDPVQGLWRIHHPTRPGAHRPLLETNDTGGWWHSLDLPQHHRGAGELLRRLDSRLATVPDPYAECLLQVTGISRDQLRRLHLERGSVPARLLDVFARHEVHQQFPALKGAAFEGYMAEHEVTPAADEAVLIRDFPGISVGGAREVMAQATGDQLEDLRMRGRVPLALAERARWYLHDSRLDRACLGLQLPQAATLDSEMLAVGLLGELAPWPASVRLEIRDDTVQGPLRVSRGDAEASEVLQIIRKPQGYQLEGAGTLTPGEPLSLLKALNLCLDAPQRALLGEPAADEAVLRQKLAAAAAGDRDKAARLIGMVASGAGIRPPRRFGDGRVGYLLSGRPESSRQAIRRGIQQVFPTLTAEQMQAYLTSVSQQRVGLWQHYTRLQESLVNLRTALQEWRGQARNPMDILRRRRVATQIRRSWRRKIVNLADEYVLEIDGERVGTLPTLPDGVDFSHVRRLTLRNMDLTAVSEQFLEHFPNLVELNLAGNRLVQVPSGLEQITGLRHLDLSGNRIVMDAAGSRRLTALPLLQRLDLGRNPLGEIPTLIELRQLRHLDLRDTGQELLPPDQQFPWRSRVDLRNNRIREIRQDLHSLGRRLQRVNLHDNPLDDASSTLLGQATRPGRNRSGHQAVDEAVRDTWLGPATGDTRARLQATWDNLRQQPHADDLFRFMADFVATDDFTASEAAYRARAWRILEVCEQNEALRNRLFLEAASERTCDDRLLLIFNQLELGISAESMLSDVPALQMERQLVRLGRSLFRLDELDRIAIRHIDSLRASEAAVVDEVETRLFYRVRLADVLDLPAPMRSMHYEGFANVNTSDLKRALAQIQRADTVAAASGSLAVRPFWESYARRQYADRFESLAAPYHRRLAELETQAQTGPEQTYLEQSVELKLELEAAERDLLQALATQACERAGD